MIALCALLLSAFAIWKTTQFNKRQLALIDSQEKLNRLLVEQRDSEQLDARRADLCAEVIRLDARSYRLKIFNKGKAIATNITLETQSDFIATNEVNQLFPLERLEPQGQVLLAVFYGNSTPSKNEILLRWSDREAANKEKNVTVTF